jgi:mRNA-degrading endonuclease RelE of RelBE toxin-antitoxin system
MVIIETPIFTKQLAATLPDDDYRQLQQTLVGQPAAGKVIPGSGGLRKLRWFAEGRGKRGGTRLIYYWFTAQGILLLLFIYPKNVQDDLTPDQLRQLKKIVEEEYHEG